MDVLTSETCWALNSGITKQVKSSWSLIIQLSRIYELIWLITKTKKAISVLPQNYTNIWLFSTEIKFLVYFIIWAVKSFDPHSQTLLTTFVEQRVLQHSAPVLHILFKKRQLHCSFFLIYSALLFLLFLPTQQGSWFFFISAFLSSLWVPLQAEMLSWTLFRSLRIYCSSNNTPSSLIISSFVYFKLILYSAEWFCN